MPLFQIYFHVSKETYLAYLESAPKIRYIQKRAKLKKYRYLFSMVAVFSYRLDFNYAQQLLRQLLSYEPYLLDVGAGHKSNIVLEGYCPY